MVGVKITWFGHSAFLFEAEKKLLIDPFISGNPVAPCSPDELDPDIIAVTHGHSDHLGDTVEIGKRTGCRIFPFMKLQIISNRKEFCRGYEQGWYS